MTQAARIEFALAGGRVNTDFIDNAGGVDCSDHEVNLKILFNQLVADRRLDAEAAQSAARRHDRRRRGSRADQQFQAGAGAVDRATSRARPRSPNISASWREWRPTSGSIARSRECRATTCSPIARCTAESLTRPELAVLLSYAKTHIKEHLIDSTIHADAGDRADGLRGVSAGDSRSAIADAVRKHRLYREIRRDHRRQRRRASPRHFFGGAPVRFRWRGTRRDRACVLRGGAVFRNP